jgi:site-specific recombinase XerD
MQSNDSQIDRAIQVWLDAKTSISGSLCTRRNYSDNLRWFRDWLQEHGLDLDSEDTYRIADLLQQWSARGEPAAQTFNNRVGIVSSFYKFARRRRLLTVDNPADMIDRVSVQMYGESRALEIDELRQKLGAIDRSTLQGKRDFALLVVALQTGRRREELAQLRMGDLELTDGKITVIWRRCKGGKKMLDTLPKAIHHHLLDYLHAVYGPVLENLAPERPVWVRLRSVSEDIEAITASAISHICEHRLNTTNVHRLRHTFAKAMEMVGAKLSDIQARLGHNSLATTGIYVAALRRDENPNAEALAALFGFDKLSLESTEPSAPLRCVECQQPFTFLKREERRQLYCSEQCSRKAQRRKMEERAAELEQHAKEWTRPYSRRRKSSAKRRRGGATAEAGIQQLGLWVS